MTLTKLMTATALFSTVALAAPATAGPGDDPQRSGGRVVVGRAAPRPVVVGPRIISPRVVGIVRYRPYYYRPGFRVGIGFGYPYYGYPYGYPAYGYGYPYGYPPPGYIASVAGRPYGGVRITDAPKDAEVFADGYYVGIVDDFDGVFQHLNLEAGPHRIEIRARGHQPIAFDVRVEPGQTIRYRAEIR